MTLEEIVEKERAKILEGTKVTLETFQQWKKFKRCGLERSKIHVTTMEEVQREERYCSPTVQSDTERRVRRCVDELKLTVLFMGL